jgi:hypothetical protein
MTIAVTKFLDVCQEVFFYKLYTIIKYLKTNLNNGVFSMKKLLTLSLLSLFAFADAPKSDDYLVKITTKLSHVMTQDSGQKIKIERVQDVQNLLTDDFTKTSRSCPPFCIQSNKVDKNIQNLAELELLNFVHDKVMQQKGILIDTRLESWFELETIPSSINIPFSGIENLSKKRVEMIFKILGMNVNSDDSWDFSKAKELAFFDNGMWCEQANHFIKVLLKYKYPTKKLFYYRAGLQGWKLLGLTTLVHKEVK